MIEFFCFLFGVVAGGIIMLISLSVILDDMEEDAEDDEKDR